MTSGAAKELETDVLIVGAGPTGLTLATALALRGVPALLIDRLPEPDTTSRATVVQARTLEVLESLQVTHRLLERGIVASRMSVRDRDRVLASISFHSLPTRYPFALLIPQATTEAVLHARLRELGGSVLRSHTLTELTQDSTGVLATLQDGSFIRAKYAVGTDGQHSSVRECCGTEFAPGSYHEDFVLADAVLSPRLSEHEGLVFLAPAGVMVVLALPGGVHRVIAALHEAPPHPTPADIQALFDERGPQGERVVVREVPWSSRFHVQHRVAATFVTGRVALAGDAAHVHSPAGGQGMNTGIQDAVTLADTLQRAVQRGDVAALDDYARTRRPIAQRVVRLSDRMSRLATISPRLRPARNLCLQALGAVPAFRRQFALGISELSFG